MGLLNRLFGSARTHRPPAANTPTEPSNSAASLRDSDDDSPHERWYVPSDDDKTRFVGADGLPSLRLIPYTDTSGEDVLRLCENDTGLLVAPTDIRLPHAGILVSQLRGEYYHQEASQAGEFAPGASVRLVPEPDNPHDSRAVAVYDASGEHLCAYMNKQKARAYLKRSKAGEVLEAISVRGTPAGQPCSQVAILAATPEALRLLLSSRPANAPTPAHLR